MKKYYYIENEIQKGPFTIEELSKENIHLKTLLWTEGMENWEEAKKIIELKEIIKIIPPPLPNKAEKPIKVEAEISRKKDKILTPEREVIIAKEAKQNYKLILISILIGIIGFIYYVNKNDGFKHSNIQTKLENDMYKNTNDYVGDEAVTLMENREQLKNESFSLGYGGYSEYYFSTNSAIEFHKNKFNESLKESIMPSLLITLISSIVLIFGRYMLKGAKWVNEKAK